MGGIGSMRGFDSAGISLRDPVTGEAIGGDKQLRGSVNLFFPLPYMRTAGIRAVAFADAGMVWGSVSTTLGAESLNISEPFSLSRMRYSAGLGFEWLSPVGPLGLVWSFPIRSFTGDKEKSFEFMLGASF
jgi:outer membrane protein insertion porin family